MQNVNQELENTCENGVVAQTFDMLIETYRSAFRKEVNIEFDEEDWEKFEE